MENYTMLRQFMIRRCRIVLSFALAISGFAQSAHGHEPQTPAILTDVQFELTGTKLHFENREEFALNVTAFPGSLSTLQFGPLTFRLAPAEVLDVTLNDLTLPPGVQAFHLVLQVTNDDGQPSGPSPSYYQALLVDAAGVLPVSYEDAFVTGKQQLVEGESEVAIIDYGGDYRSATPINRLSFATLEADPAIDPIFYNAPSPLLMAAMPPLQLPDSIDLGAGADLLPFSPQLPRLQAPDFAVSSHDVKTDALPIPLAHQPAAITSGFRGRFSLALPSNQYHAAWGWVVKAWQYVAGIWLIRGWTYVNGDGTWEIPFSPFPGPVRIEYEAANRFVQIQNKAGNIYAWADNWNVTGPVTDIGHRAANLTATGMPGVEKLYLGATNVWVKFHANGLNALRDKPIPVTYPNTDTNNCKRLNKAKNPQQFDPWSCSIGNGASWVIPEHTNDFTVIQHELGHSINRYFWGSQWPSDAGGDHDLDKCGTNGMALTEGFANFVAAWTQFSFNETNPKVPYYDFNTETPPANWCTGQGNEIRVAATFWDTYDLWNDGSGNAFDSLFYTNPGAPIALYLKTYKSKMADYLDVMKAGQSAYWQGEFTKLYRLNTIIP